jgi:hypothetical protein
MLNNPWSGRIGFCLSFQKRYNDCIMHERDIFDERHETKKANYSCPFCRERNDYDIRWLKRVKKKNPPRNLNQQERAQFDKSRDYMVRVDDQLMCMNIRCRKRFEIPSSQTVVFI